MSRPTFATRRFCLAVCAVLMPLCLCIQGRAEEPIRWKFKVGEKLDCKVTQDFAITMSMGPADQRNPTLHQVMDMTLDVQGVNQAGEAVIVVKFDRIQSKVSNPEPVEFDSAKDAPADGKAATYAPLYKAMTQGDFEVTMTARGEIKDVKVPQDVLDVLKTNQQAMGDLATPKGLQEAIMRFSFVLPEKAPELGERSSSHVDVNNSMGGISVETSYTFEGISEVDGQKMAKFRPSIKMNVEGNSTMQSKMTDQKSDGVVLFNVDQGRLESVDQHYHASREVTIAGRTLPQQITQAIQVKLAAK
jgi:Family of unknown function (DUF6263)